MPQIGPNSPCPCGSGKTFETCCGSPISDEPRRDRGGIAAGPARGEPLDALERSAQGGDSRAAVRLGVRYLMGRDAPRDLARGATLILEAAKAGDAQGAFLAATLASSTLWRNRSWDVALDYLTLAARQGHEASQHSLRILAGGPSGNTVEGEDWAEMRAEIDLAAWLTAPARQRIHDAPRIHIIEKFAPPAACDWLIAQSRDCLSRATIYDRTTGGTTEDDRRTNSQCDLDIENCGVLTFVLRGRIAAVTGRPDRAMEIPKILHYAPGETFAAHFDYLDPSEPAYASELARRGQRTDTFLIYLNEDFTGGETHFPRVGLSHVGAKGDALLFANIDPAGLPDRETMHAGLPPASGEKWIFSQWIREFPGS